MTGEEIMEVDTNQMAYHAIPTLPHRPQNEPHTTPPGIKPDTKTKSPKIPEQT